jgi:hypothetical protein
MPYAEPYTRVQIMQCPWPCFPWAYLLAVQGHYVFTGWDYLEGHMGKYERPYRFLSTKRQADWYGKEIAQGSRGEC